jgi:hypothetical protein
MLADQDRRDFLKTAAVASATGITAATTRMSFAQAADGGSQLAWTTGMQINPAIDNTRVICCHDTNMIATTPANSSWAIQNSCMNATLIASNMDEMAMQLTQKTTATDAWSTIFRSSKAWASTTVAIKTNGILGLSGNHPRVAVIKKICDVFVDQFGVPAANIVLYDATDDASVVYSSYASLTDATKMRCVVSVLAGSLGNYVPVNIVNAVAGEGAVECVADLANGNIDILVDIAVAKAHYGPGTSAEFGSVTLCMKNHLGTFNRSAGHAEPLHSMAAICEINQHQAILGGTPTRQQLCIIDALLCNSQSPAGSWDTRADRLVMGTFAPIVDYLTGIIVMQNVVNAGSTMKNMAEYIPQFLTNFGYTVADVPLTGGTCWIESVPGVGFSDAGNGGGGSSSGSGSGSGSSSSSGGSSSGTASGGRSSSGGGGSSSGGGGSSSGGGKSSSGSSPGTSSSSGSSPGTSSSSGSSPSTSSSSGSSPSTSSSSGSSPSTSSSGASSTSSSSGSSPSTSSSGASSPPGNGNSSGGGAMTGTQDQGGSGGGGCDVASVEHRTTPWGAMLGVGAVVAGTLRRLVPRAARERAASETSAGGDSSQTPCESDVKEGDAQR